MEQGAPVMSKAHVRAVYDGPALDGGVMEVADFAPALLAVAETCQRANYVINGGKTRLSVQIQAEPQDGCFGIDLNLVVISAANLITLLPGFYTSAKSIVDTLFGENSLFDVIRRIGDQEPQTPPPSITGGDNMIVIPGDDANVGPITLTVNKPTYNLIMDPTARRYAKRAMRVLRQPGIDTLEIGTRERNTTITKADIKALTGALNEAVAPNVIESERQAVVDVKNFAPDERKKSCFYDGTATFWARIDDPLFWKRYHDREYGYYDKDRFLVRILTRQEVGEKLKTEHVIVEVSIIEPPAEASGR